LFDCAFVVCTKAIAIKMAPNKIRMFFFINDNLKFDI
jgi:hypothetical protein